MAGLLQKYVPFYIPCKKKRKKEEDQTKRAF
jgi:hypothetical protein